MRFHCLWSIFVVLIFAFSVRSQAVDTNQHVILITIDGFAAYLLDDPQAPIPTLRRMAREGASAEGMRVSNPAVTWPNHTTLVTGVHPRKHSVLFNGVLVRPGPGLAVRVDPKRDKADLVKLPTIYDMFHKAGLRTAGINWPCTRSSGTLHDDFPDVPEPITHSTPRLRSELVSAGILADETERSFSGLSGARRDQIWTEAALHVIQARRPHFLLWHMLVTDSLHHKYGAQSPAGYAGLAQADSQLRLLLQTLDQSGLRQRTTIFVVADHGFEKALKLVQPNVLFRKAGLLQTGATPLVTKARAQIISEGGIALVYLTEPGTLEADAEKVRALLRDQEGIAEILGPDQFAALGLPDPETNPQMANLILVAREGYAFNNNALGDDYITTVTLAAGNQGHHGYLASNAKMNAVFVAWGAKIKAATRLGVFDNVDIAPTIAKLFGVELPNADGKPLPILQSP